MTEEFLMKKDKKKLVHILMSDYTLDSRVRNETVSLFEDNYDVDVYCLKSETINKNEIREGVSLRRFGKVGGKIVNFLTAYISMFLYSLNKNIDCVHAHDVTSLPIAYLISIFKRVPFIYDSHELWSQAHHESSSKLILNTISFFEKKIAKRATSIITVSDSIKKYLEEHFKVNNINVIRNIPSYTHLGKYDIFREKFGIDQNTKICLYQGLISKTRGVELIVEAALNICKSNDKVVFFFLGNGDYLEDLKHLVFEKDLTDQIKILGFIKQDELLKYTMSADIGIHAIYNSCLNHNYCLPNKVFEYIHSGVVLVVTNLVELDRFVKENNIGVTFEDNNSQDLEIELNNILNNDKLFSEMKNNSIELAKKLTWENEYKKLKKIYGDIAC